LSKGGHEVLVAELNGGIIGVLHWIIYPDIIVGGYDAHILFLLIDEALKQAGQFHKETPMRETRSIIDG